MEHLVLTLKDTQSNLQERALRSQKCNILAQNICCIRNTCHALVHQLVLWYARSHSQVPR